MKSYDGGRESHARVIVQSLFEEYLSVEEMFSDNIQVTCFPILINDSIVENNHVLHGARCRNSLGASWWWLSFHVGHCICLSFNEDLFLIQRKIHPFVRLVVWFYTYRREIIIS